MDIYECRHHSTTFPKGQTSGSQHTHGMKVAEHSSHQFLAALIGKCHAVINGVSRMMSSLLNHLASVLNPVEIEDLKAHTLRAQKQGSAKEVWSFAEEEHPSW